MNEEKFEMCKQWVKDRFFDLDLIMFEGTPYINGNSIELDWRIKINKLGLEFRQYHDLHDDLILISNKIRKELYNVI